MNLHIFENDYKLHKNIKQIVKDRGQELDFYVLRYDIKSTAYNNEIVFKTYEEALDEFCKTYPDYPDERIELIFSPQMNDKEYFENELLITREINRG